VVWIPDAHRPPLRGCRDRLSHLLGGQPGGVGEVSGVVTQMNPEWRTPEPDEVVECRINLLTGEVTQKTMAEVMDDYRADFFVLRFWDQKELKKLNQALGFK